MNRYLINPILSLLVFYLIVFSNKTIFCDDLDSTDYPVKVCDQILATQSPQDYGWWYADGLTMMGMYRVWQRTGNADYFDFFKSWLDRFVSESGLVGVDFNHVDGMHNGFALCYMYGLTGEEKYRTAAQQIRTFLDSYRRTTDGTPVHNAGADELWLDGCWMLGNFLNNFGIFIGEKAFCDSMNLAHIINMDSHCNDPENNIPFHAWDEDGSASWADPVTHQSAAKWCRAIGWLVMDIVEVLDSTPSSHPLRQPVIDILQKYLRGLKSYQDSVTGLWFQVVTKPEVEGNWVEHSSACMYSYAMAKAIDKGYVTADEFLASAKLAYQGNMGNVLLNTNGYPDVYGTCEGTSVSDYNYYINRQQPINDPHGKGAWFISCEYQRTRYGSNIKRIYQAEVASFDGTVESEYRGYTGSGFVNTPNTPGASIEWTVHQANAGMKKLTFRYANGSTNDRPADIVVNGATVNTSLSFSPGRWNRWDSQSIHAHCNVGDNTVRMVATTAQGCPNVDMLAVDSVAEQTTITPVRQTSAKPVAYYRSNILTSSGRFTVPDGAIGTSSIAVFTLSGRLLYTGNVQTKSIDLTKVISRIPTSYIIQISSVR